MAASLWRISTYPAKRRGHPLDPPWKRAVSLFLTNRERFPSSVGVYWGRLSGRLTSSVLGRALKIPFSP